MPGSRCRFFNTDTNHIKNFASHGVICTGIHGDESGITFTVEGQGGDQWVSFYHQSKLFHTIPIIKNADSSLDIDDMGFGDQRESSPFTTQDGHTTDLETAFGQPDRIGGTWQLRRFSSIIVNGDEKQAYKLSQKDTHKGTLLAATIKLPLKKGKNTLRIGGVSNGTDCKGADLDRVVVYPLEQA